MGERGNFQAVLPSDTFSLSFLKFLSPEVYPISLKAKELIFKEIPRNNTNHVINVLYNQQRKTIILLLEAVEILSNFTTTQKTIN